MEMSGGYVTGNFSTLAGGGIYAGYYAGDGGVKFTMSGGTIAANCAQYGEGGGLRIGGGDNGGTYGVIRTEGKVYITNNKTLTTDDWGGGGIFVQEGGHLSVMDALSRTIKRAALAAVWVPPYGQTCRQKTVRHLRERLPAHKCLSVVTAKIMIALWRKTVQPL